MSKRRFFAAGVGFFIGVIGGRIVFAPVTAPPPPTPPVIGGADAPVELNDGGWVDAVTGEVR